MFQAQPVIITIVPVRGGFAVREKSSFNFTTFPKFNHALNCARARASYRTGEIHICDKLGLAIRKIPFSFKRKEVKNK